MLTVEVKSAEVLTKKGISRTTQKPYVIREQELWVDLGLAYPERVVRSLFDEEAPLAAGKYMLDKSCFRVSRFGKLEVDLRKLKPIVSAASRSA